MLGVETEWESRFMLPMAEVRIRINSQERTTI